MNIENNKLSEYVSKHPNVLHFLDRLGIELGFGEKTIKDVCQYYDIDIYFFTELLNLIIKRYQFDSQYSDKFELQLTVTYLKNSHTSYLQEYLPILKHNIEFLLKHEIGRERDLQLIKKHLEEYESDFIEHLKDEDETIYPYVILLSEASKTKNFSIELKHQVENNSILQYLKKHDSVDEKLSDLKNLVIKYFKPFKHKTVVHSFLKTIFELEEDLKLHELIENQILFKQAKSLEEKIVSSF